VPTLTLDGANLPTCARGSRSWSGRASSFASKPRSIRRSRSRRSPTAPSRRAARRSSSRTSRARRARCSSTSFGTERRMCLAFDAPSARQRCRQAQRRPRAAAARGAHRQGARPAEAQVDRRLTPENGSARAVAGHRPRGRRRVARSPSDPDLLARRRRALHHPARRDHEGSEHGHALTSGCTGCRSSARARRRCTGRSTRTGARTISPPTGGSRSPSRSASTPVTRTARAHRCRSTSTS